jgi:hypothetical protein
MLCCGLQLEPLLLQTSISILQLLVQRFWFEKNLSLLAKCQTSTSGERHAHAPSFAVCCSPLHVVFVCFSVYWSVLRCIAAHHWGKAAITAGIAEWRREDMERQMDDAEQQRIVDKFERNVAEVLAQRTTKERKSRKRGAANLNEEQRPEAEAGAELPAPSLSNTPQMQQSMLMPAPPFPFLPFFFDGYVQQLALHPAALCLVDVPLDLTVPRQASLRPPQPRQQASVGPDTDSTAVTSLSSPERRIGLDTVAAAAAAAAAAETDAASDAPVHHAPAKRARRSSSTVAEKEAVVMRPTKRATKRAKEPEQMDAESDGEGLESAHATLTLSRKVMDQHPAEATSSDSAVATSSVGGVSIPDAAAATADAGPQVHVVPSLRAPLLVPLELLSLGLSAWQRKRAASTTDVRHRDAMDGALSELMWQLADQLTDGERLDLPEFHQARRSPSRPASAAHNARMEGERQCTMMLRMLEKMAAQSAPAPCSGGSASMQVVTAPSLGWLRLADAEAVPLLLSPNSSTCAKTGEQPSLCATSSVSSSLPTGGTDAQAPVLTVAEVGVVPTSSPSGAEALQAARHDVSPGR